MSKSAAEADLEMMGVDRGTDKDGKGAKIKKKRPWIEDAPSNVGKSKRWSPGDASDDSERWGSW